MERYNFEKTIGEIDCLIKEHEKRENTFTMSVLQTCREYVEELKQMKDLEQQCIEENQCGIRELLVKWKAFFDDIAELYDYRKAEEQGLLLRLPVAEGAEVFVIDFIYECKYRFNCPATFREYKCEEGEFCEHQYKKHIVKAARFNYAMMKKLGETVFLTREEAEAALAEKGGAE